MAFSKIEDGGRTHNYIYLYISQNITTLILLLIFSYTNFKMALKIYCVNLFYWIY